MVARACALRARHHFSGPLLSLLFACHFAVALGFVPPLPRVVVAFCTYPARYELVAWGRGTWRHDTSAFIVTEGAQEGSTSAPAEVDGLYATLFNNSDTAEFDKRLETWWTYPQDSVNGTYKATVSKTAAVLRLANQSLGTSYDWIAHGDDDTIFFMDAVYEVVHGLDPNMPYLLSDSVSTCDPTSIPGGRGGCKTSYSAGTVCTLPRNHHVARGQKGAGGGCFAHAPCTVDVLHNSTRDGCSGPADAISLWYSLPFPCGHGGMLVSRGLMRALSAEQWKQRAESLEDKTGGGEVHFMRYIINATGFVQTDPTPVFHPPFCAFNFETPRTMTRVAADVVSSNGICNATCDRILHRTVTVTTDTLNWPRWNPTDEERMTALRELQSTLQLADAKINERNIATLPERVRADAQLLNESLRRAGFAPGVPLVAVLTSSRGIRGDLFLNFASFTTANALPLLVFTTDVETETWCKAIVESACNASLPCLCFFASNTHSAFDMTPGPDHFFSRYWKRVVTVTKPAALALVSDIDAPVLLTETDVVLRANVITALASSQPRPLVTLQCLGPYNRSIAGDMREENVGVIYLRQRDPRLYNLSLAHLLLCSGPRKVDDQFELVDALRRMQSSWPSERIVGCVDQDDGWSNSCKANDAARLLNNSLAIHATCLTTTEYKADLFKKLGLWRPLLDPFSPPPPAPPPPWPPPLPPSPPPSPPPPSPSPPPLPPSPPPPPPRPPMQEDPRLFVAHNSSKYARLRFAAGTFEFRHPLAAVGSRTWRRHVPAWLVTTTLANSSNATLLKNPPWHVGPLETWWTVLPPADLAVGRQRNGMAVRLGNATDRSFDWVLYGDDDTLFFVDAALEMLTDLDPALPYYIGPTSMEDTPCTHYAEKAIFCAVPGTPESVAYNMDGSTCLLHPARAPCRRALFEGNSSISCPTSVLRTVWGGSGFILSRGMVDAISADAWRSWEYKNGESDALMSQNIWAAGFAPTVPEWFPRSTTFNAALPNSRLVADGEPMCHFGRGSGFQEVWEAAKQVLSTDKCDDRCMVRLTPCMC